MNTRWVVCAVLLCLLLSSPALAQSLVDLKIYREPSKNGAQLGEARARIDDVVTGRGEGRFPGSRRVANGPAGVPLRETGKRDPRSPSGQVTGSGRNPASSAGIFLTRHDVKVRIVDGAAVVTMDQTFHNGNGVTMEGTYVCPLPDHSVIDGFSIFMDGAEVQGVVMERSRGRAAYREIVRKKKDPGIVELVEGAQPFIRTNIFPIPAGGDFRVKTRYTHLLSNERGTRLARYRLKHLCPDGKPPLERLGLDVRARTSWPLETVTAPEYPFNGKLSWARKGWIGRFAASKLRPEDDLTVRCVPRAEEPGVAVHVHTNESGKRFFMAVVTAGMEPLEDAQLVFAGARPFDVYPTEIPTLEPGRQALVFGRLPGSRPATARLSGTAGGRPIVLSGESSHAATERGSDFVGKMWAVHRVRDLVRAAKGAPDAVQKAEIVRLAERYGILTPYTVFFAR